MASPILSYQSKETNRLGNTGKQLKYTPKTTKPKATALIGIPGIADFTTRVTPQPTPRAVAPVQTGGGGGGGGYNAAAAAAEARAAEAAYQKWRLETPGVMSAAELARIYSIDYNEKNILNQYNEKTNKYYTDAVAEQSRIRNAYALNNADFTSNIVSDYLNSYKNATPTSIAQGTQAANALSTLLNADVLNAQNDYGMLQSLNTLEEARKAELLGNADLARQYYNQMGAYLSTLSASKNKSDVQAYIYDLDSYGKQYEADRSYQSALAQAAASNYAGAANAAASRASSTASGYNSNSYQQLYNYFANTKGTNYADTAIASLLNV